MTGFRTVGLSIAAVTIAVLGGYLFAAQAQAASYDVYSCRGPVGQPLSSAAWEARFNDSEAGDLTVTDTCPSGGAVTLETNPAGINGPRKARLDYSFKLPAGTTISSFQLIRSIRTSPTEGGLTYNYRSGIRQSIGATSTEMGCSSVFAPAFACSSVGSPTNPADLSNVFDVAFANLTGLGVFAGCASVGCDYPQYSPGAEFRFYGSRVTIEDNDPPTIDQVDGTLAAGQPVSGRTDFFVRASDENSGVKSVSLTIDGTPYATIASTGLSCTTPYQVARPCPAEAGRIFAIDADSLSLGNHVATGEVTDAAGNVTPYGPVNFTVEDGNVPGPVVPDNGDPAIPDPVLALDSDLIEHAPSQPATISGSLQTPGGTPIVGATLMVTTTELGLQTLQPKPAPSVVTGPDGKFVISLQGGGAQKVLVAYAPVLGGAQARTASATVRSRIALSLIVKRRVQKSQPVSFSGRLLGAGSAARGANVEIQAVSRGRWQTVATVTADANGRYAWKYRFRYVESDALFTFRALVRSTPGWPWPDQASANRKVRIVVK